MSSNCELSENIEELRVSAVIVLMTDGEKPYAEEAINSALTQNLLIDVIIIVSDSNSWISNIVEGMPVRIYRIPRCNAAHARNFGASVAYAPYLAYMDGDDFWSPVKIQTQLRVIQETGADLVGTGHYLVDEKSIPFARAPARFIPMTSSWLLRTELLRDCPFNEDLDVDEDGDWWIRYSKRLKTVRIPDPLLQYRVRNSSLSSSSRSKRKKLMVRRISDVGLRPIILLVSVVFCWMYKSKKYTWHRDWN